MFKHLHSINELYLEDRRNLKFGLCRIVSPDENGIFNTDGQVGSVEICDNGWGQIRITPEECQQRLEGTETDIEIIKKDIESLEFELNDLKLKFSKKLYNVNMERLFPKKENEEEKKTWLEERRNIRKYNARLNAVLDELEDYYHYEEYKKQLNLLFESYQLEDLLK